MLRCAPLISSIVCHEIHHVVNVEAMINPDVDTSEPGIDPRAVFVMLR